MTVAKPRVAPAILVAGAKPTTPLTLMKSYLLVLLLAITPLVIGLLDRESSESAAAEPGPPAKSCAVPTPAVQPPAATSTKPAVSRCESPKVEARNSK